MLLALVVSFVGAIVARLLVPHVRHSGWVMAVLPGGLFAYFLVTGLGLEGADAIVERMEWVPTLRVAVTLRLDGLSWLFALVITGIGALVTIYAGAYFSHAPARQRASFITLILLFMSAMLGTVLADDLIVLFVFWEATSLLSFALIGFHSTRTEARKAALQALVVTAGGGLALLGGILLIGSELGTFALSDIVTRSADLARSDRALPILGLILIGAFTKSAQVPFHFWLPAAMEAPTPASAYLHSATMVKLGVYLLARFDRVFAELPAFGTTLLIVGSATVLVASVAALAARGYKSVLAQSTLGSLGILVMLVGLDGPHAATATVVFILAHALYKAALFFCAGTAIHATHEGSLQHLRGLRGALPLTALAAGLAALSMAGLPPMFGFIAKEALFEGYLQTAVGTLGIGVAWLGSTAFVAIAGMVAVGPFLLGTQRPTPVHEGESAGLTVGPLLLGTLGLSLGVVPGTVGALIEPATAALLGHSVPVSLSLWHGVTPSLVLSACAIVAGVVLFVKRQAIHHRLAHSGRVSALVGDDAYQWLFNGVLNVAARSTHLLQNGDQRRYSAVVLTAVVVVTVVGLLASGSIPHITLTDDGPFDMSSFVVLVLMAIGAFAATRERSLLTAVVAVGVVGFGSAVIYLLNGAPDLALTQFSVEVLVVVMFTALLLRLPDRAAPTRVPREQRRDWLIAVAIGLVLFTALAAMTQAPFDRRLSEYFADTSYTVAHGRNVVNVIIVDYRGLDTLGEISVVAFAAIGVWGLLRRRGASSGRR